MLLPSMMTVGSEGVLDPLRVTVRVARADHRELVEGRHRVGVEAIDLADPVSGDPVEVTVSPESRVAVPPISAAIIRK